MRRRFRVGDAPPRRFAVDALDPIFRRRGQGYNFFVGGFAQHGGVDLAVTHHGPRRVDALVDFRFQVLLVVLFVGAQILEPLRNAVVTIHDGEHERRLSFIVRNHGVVRCPVPMEPLSHEQMAERTGC